MTTQNIPTPLKHPLKLPFIQPQPKIQLRKNPKILLLFLILIFQFFQPFNQQSTEPNNYCGKYCTFCDFTTGLCLTCTIGYYMEPTSKICTPCATGCATCNGASASNCFNLKSGYYYSTPYSAISACGDINCNYCITGGTSQCKFCKIGYNLTTTNTCVIADQYCQSKKSSTDHTVSSWKDCAECIPNYFLYDYASLSSLGSFPDFSCLQCPDHCAVCSNFVACIQCEDGYYSTTSTPYTSCTKCPDNYKSCTSGSANFLVCNKGYYIISDGASQKCKQCQATCQNDGCGDGTTPDRGCKTSAKCNSGSYFESYQCEECPVGSSTCNSSNALSCLPMFWINTTATPNSCISASRGCTTDVDNTGCTACDSAKNYYLNGSTCSECSVGCQTCGTGGCIDCGTSSFFRHDSSNKICEPCPYNCKTCNTSSSTCDASGCDTHFWRDGSNFLCKPCTQGCNGSCSDTIGCSSANEGWISLSGSTGPTKCETGCKVCTSSGSCTTCFSTYYKDGTGTCTICPPGCVCTDYTNNLSSVGCTSCIVDGQYYYSSNSCVACEANCLACSSTTICTKCDNPNHYFISTADCIYSGDGCSTTGVTGCSIKKDGYMIDGSNITQKCTDIGATNCSPVATAIACESNYYLSSGNCIQCYWGCTACNTSGCQSSSNVQNGFYYVAGTPNTVDDCRVAKTNCKQCSSAGTCGTCQENYYVTGGNCVGCSEGCASGNCLTGTSGCSGCVAGSYYVYDSSNKVCKFCEEGCSACSSSYPNCDTCMTGWFKPSGASTTCQKCSEKCDVCTNSQTCTTCTTGFWLYDFICQPCPAACTSCTDLQTCTAVVVGYYLNSNRKATACPTNCSSCQDGIGCVTCVTGTIINNSTGICEACPANCSLCTTTSKCITCNVNYYQYESYICRKCPTNCVTCSNGSTCHVCADYYFKTLDNTCENCGANCRVCTSANTCATCITGYYGSAGVCMPCGEGCDSCTSETSCSTCSTGYYKTSDNRCYPCQSAMPGCLTCSDRKTCSTCEANFYMYSFGDNTRCIVKEKGCETVVNNTGCTKCYPGSYLVGNKCLQSNIAHCKLTNRTSFCLWCYDDYFWDGSACTGCERGCFRCTNASTCLIPKLNFRLNGVSVQKCPIYCNYCDADQNLCTECRPGYWQKQEIISGTTYINCQACPGSCETCNTFDYCTSCIPGNFINGDNVCASCPSNCDMCSDYQGCNKCADYYYPNTSGTECVRCSSDCLECVNSTTCMKCDEGFILENNICVKCPYMCKNCADNEGCAECFEGYYIDATSGMCGACPHKCKTCSSSNICLECQTGYYKNSVTNLCVICPFPCETCDGPYTCASCIGNYYQKYDRTCDPCYNGCVGCSGPNAIDCITSWSNYYLNYQNTPTLCPYGCQTGQCQDHHGCIECSSSFFLTTDKTCRWCDENCKSGKCSDRIGCLECADTYWINNENSPQDSVNYLCTFCSTGCQAGQCLAALTGGLVGCQQAQTGYYIDSTLKLALKCNELATTCTSAVIHTACVDNYAIDPSNQCRFCSQGCAYGYCTNTNGCYHVSNDPCLPGYFSVTKVYTYFNNSGVQTTFNWNECTRCIPNCEKCQNTSKCYDSIDTTPCFVGFRKIPLIDSCTKCPNNCDVCEMDASTPPRPICSNSGCSPGFFKNSVSKFCEVCEASCKTCTDATTCSTCFEGYYENSNNCSACTSPCSTCNTSATNCTGCIYGYFLSGASCIDCTVGNGASCKRCSGASTCTQCAVTTVLNSTACQSCIANCKYCTTGGTCTECTDNWHLDTTNNICRQCGNNCLSCTNNICVICIEGYYLNGSNVCTACLTDCAKCTTGSNCTKCFSGYILNSGTSCDSCQTSIGGSNPYCMRCNSSRSDCTDAYPGYFVNTGANKEAQACSVLNCKTCTDATNTCTTCEDGFAQYAVSGSETACVKCYEGNPAWPHSTSPHNTYLYYSCLHCAIDDKDCLQCNIGYIKDTQTSTICRKCDPSNTNCAVCSSIGTCTNCHFNYYLASPTACSACTVTNCKFCADGTQACQLCKENYWYRTISGNNPLCQPCGTNYLTCSPTAGPTQCANQYYVGTQSDGFGTYPHCEQTLGNISNNCSIGTNSSCTTCQPYYYVTGAGSTCSSCSANCISCTSNTVCTTCAAGFWKNSTACSACADSNCKVCTDSTALTCTECNDNFYRHNGVCLTCSTFSANCKKCESYGCTECSAGYYADGLTSCKACTADCTICTKGNECDECNTGKIMNLKKQCMPCMDGCIDCTNGQSTCDECQLGYMLVREPTAGYCTACSAGCDYCNLSGCQVCRHGYNQSGVICSKSCNDQCAQCDNGVCQEAMPGYRLDVDGTLEQCYYDNCMYCPDNSKQCFKCIDGYYYLQEKGCYACHSDCQTCTGVLDEDCVLCPNGKKKLMVNVVSNDLYWQAVRSQSKFGYYVDATLISGELQVTASVATKRFCVTTCPANDGSAPISNYSADNFYSMQKSTLMIQMQDECEPWLLFNQS